VRVAVIVGPTLPFATQDTARIRTWFEAGGGLFVPLEPGPRLGQRRMLPLGLETLTSAAGIEMNETFVFEGEPARKLPGGFGEQFLAEPKLHEITRGLVGERNRDLKILMTASRSLSRTGSSVPAAELLATSPEAFGMTDFFGWADKGGPPQKTKGRPARSLGARDGRRASEEIEHHRPRPSHGRRRYGERCARTELAGAGAARGRHLHESALSWLAAEPPIVDVPDKPAAAGARINEASLGELLRYVTLYLPGAILLAGIAVYLRRRVSDVRAGDVRSSASCGARSLVATSYRSRSPLSRSGLAATSISSIAGASARPRPTRASVTSSTPFVVPKSRTW